MTARGPGTVKALRASIPYAGAAMVLAGFAVVALAWRGAARLPDAESQVTAALSGGLAGLALVLAGMTVLALETHRALSLERSHDLLRLQEQVDELIRLLVRPGPDETVEDQTLIDVAAGTVVRRIDRRPAGTRGVDAPGRGEAAERPEDPQLAEDATWAPPRRAPEADEPG